MPRYGKKTVLGGTVVCNLLLLCEEVGSILNPEWC